MASGPTPTKKPPAYSHVERSKLYALLHNPYFYVLSIVFVTAGFLLFIFFYHQGLNAGHRKFELDKATYYNENEARKDSIRLIRDSLKIIRIQYAELRKIELGLPAEKLDSLKFLISLNDTLSLTRKKLVAAEKIIQELQQPMSTKGSTDDPRRNKLIAGRTELSKIFSGSWAVIYLDSILPHSKKPYQVNFDLLTSGRYFEKDIHTHNLEGIDISDDLKSLRFTKVPVNGQGKNLEVELLRHSNGHYKGTENGRRVDYKKYRDW